MLISTEHTCCMQMRFDRQDPGHDRIATLDIETTHYKPSKGEIVSIGVGVHHRGEPGGSATWDTFHRDGDGETPMIRGALNRLSEYNADGLVSYNGRSFDLEFIGRRLDQLGETVKFPEIATESDRHVDLYVDRKRRADQENAKWPSLEECLDSYGYPCPVTRWNGAEITNSRFGEEIGPAYLAAIGENSPQSEALQKAIDHYLTTDLEANIALYYADIGDTYSPHLLGTERDF